MTTAQDINRTYLIWLIIAGLIEGTSTLLLHRHAPEVSLRPSTGRPDTGPGSWLAVRDARVDVSDRQVGRAHLAEIDVGWNAGGDPAIRAVLHRLQARQTHA